MIKINYHKRQVYGLEKKYITDERLSKIIEMLTGKKTIDDRDIQALEELGLKVEHVPIH